jgi:uncharacterized protein (DUF697 family)
VSEQSPDWLDQQFERAYEEMDRGIGRFNLAIFGKAGVGKTTLRNVIFGTDEGATGIGRPVTRENKMYVHVSGHLGVLDTIGLEIGRDDAAILSGLKALIEEKRKEPLYEQVHVAWYCVRAGDNRFEQTEDEFIRALAGLGLPVLVVLTQVPFRNGRYHPNARELADHIEKLDLPLRGPVFLTKAQKDDFDDSPAHGLQEVLDATFRVAPEGVQNALTVAQKIDMARKRNAARAAIKWFAGTAAGIGATPVPFADAALLVPIQLAMMARIAIIYDVKYDRALAGSLAGTAATTATGRSVVGGLLKFLPGVGTAVGGVIEASVASALTWAMGEAWQLVCERLYRGDFQAVAGALDSKAIGDAFLSEFRQSIRKHIPGNRSS